MRPITLLRDALADHIALSGGDECAVLNAAIDAKVPYLDVCDDAEYAKKCKSRSPEAAAAGVPCVTTGGIYPGVSNLMAAERDIEAETARLIQAMQDVQGRLVLVANELGLGVVPENAMARAFRNHHGTLNQAVAAAADRVIFVAAGLPLALKGSLD